MRQEIWGLGMAVASAGLYANSLHLAADRQTHQHLITQFLHGCCSRRSANSVKALKALAPKALKHKYDDKYFCYVGEAVTAGPTPTGGAVQTQPQVVQQPYPGNQHASAAADGPARRAASRASCCRRRWTLSVINWLSIVASVVNLV